MAQRRMFSLSVVDTDLFLDMPASTQALYFHLGMRADDDGFVASPKKITKVVNCSSDDLKLLIAKGFVIIFETGVCVIRDWKQNNYIQKDRYHKSIYTHEKSLLSVSESGSYCMQDSKQDGHIPDTPCIQTVSSTDTEVRLVEDSIEKEREEKTREEKQQKKSSWDTPGLPGLLTPASMVNTSQPLRTNNIQTSSHYKPTWFERFWELYPNKIGKIDAMQAWDCIRPDEDLCAIIGKAIETWKKTQQWKDGKIPSPANWLRGGRWTDEVPKEADPYDRFPVFDRTTGKFISN